MTLAQFPAFLFLFLSSCYAPSQSPFSPYSLHGHIVNIPLLSYMKRSLEVLVACCGGGGTTALFLPGLDNCSQPLLELKYKLTAFNILKQHFRQLK